jgi:hypothetical protein
MHVAEMFEGKAAQLLVSASLSLLKLTLQTIGTLHKRQLSQILPRLDHLLLQTKV